MATIHILDRIGTSGSDYNAVVHFAMPQGVNAVGVPWKTCHLASKGASPPKSRLTVVGSGPGQITQGELNDITRGDVVEEWFTYSDYEEAVTQEQKDRVMDDLAKRAVDAFTEGFIGKFKYYGYTRA